MKNKIIACLVAAFVAIPLAGASAADKPFSFRIAGNTLHIFSPDGQEIGTGLPPATIGKTIDAPPYSFQVSFGSDANGNLSVIVTPNPENPTPLNFVVDNRSVQMDRNSVVTITLGSNGTTLIDPGLSGGVKVDNRTTVAAAGPAASASVVAAAASPGTLPSQQPPDAAPGATTQNTNTGIPNTPNSPLASDITAPPLGLPAQPAFNANPVAVAVNSPTVVSTPTAAPPTTPF